MAFVVATPAHTTILVLDGGFFPVGRLCCVGANNYMFISTGSPI